MALSTSTSPPASLRRLDGRAVLWRELPGLTPYGDVMLAMDRQVDRVLAGAGREEVWLSENNPGVSRGMHAAQEPDDSLPIEGGARRAHVGGCWYHGPGALVAIVILDLTSRRKDVPGINAAVHWWLLQALHRVGATAAELDNELAGIWLGGHKVAAVVLNLRRWVTSYGFAINVDPDMAAFARIAPCNARPESVTSLARAGLAVSLADMRAALREEFHRTFGPTTDAAGVLEEGI